MTTEQSYVGRGNYATTSPQKARNQAKTPVQQGHRQPLPGKQEIVWKPMAGFKGGYEVSNLGEIRSLYNGNIIRTQISKSGTRCITLRPLYGEVGSEACIYIGEVVAKAFLGNPKNNARVVHIDGDLRNDKASNLKWAADLVDTKSLTSKKYTTIEKPEDVFKPDNYRHRLKLAGVRILFERQKKPISVRYRMRPLPNEYLPHPSQTRLAKTDRQYGLKSAPIQIRLTVQGNEDGGFYLKILAPEDGPAYADYVNGLIEGNNYGSVVTVNPDLWDQAGQCLKGRSLEVSHFNDELKKIELRFREIYTQQVARYIAGEGVKPTLESVKAEYLSGQILETKKGGAIRLSKSVFGAAQQFYQHLKTRQGTESSLASATLRKKRYSIDHLERFLTYEDTLDMRASEIKQGWVKRFYGWLIQERSTTPTTAAGYVTFIRQLVDYLVEHDQLPYNPLHGMKLPKSKTKTVVWLSPEQTEAVFNLNGLKQHESRTLFWLKVMCLTGLDYVDAIRYVNNRSAYEVQGIGGHKIVIKRSKNDSECHIPISVILESVLAGPIGWAYDLEYLNRGLKKIGKLIGFPHTLTSKVARKTAGANWLLEGYVIHEISRFLGHSTTATTERYYVKTSSVTVDRAMQRMSNKGQENNSSPLSSIHKAA
ncbi:hypothetical protein GO755_39805 [Spirosoma sp. HMF4905]|uniref:Tyrosine-type recombinase/integrase n=1 Tax=Spirosoma arboris TaxID=2682092 RepID=A0A7K1SR97_9BACT|nr:NUMOD4 domain-containing protein [Spirosoma arboris]MVM36223.1 hypothetical protein [Spirosoma arboris]